MSSILPGRAPIDDAMTQNDSISGQTGAVDSVPSATENRPLHLAQLEEILRACDPAALLVPPRILRRVIEHHRHITGVGLKVPHRKCFTIQTKDLFQLVEREELDLPPHRE